MSADQTIALLRIADATERIADALEKRSRAVREPITITLDGKTLAQQVIHHTLRRAVRGSSPLAGGTLEK